MPTVVWRGNVMLRECLVMLSRTSINQRLHADATGPDTEAALRFLHRLILSPDSGIRDQCVGVANLNHLKERMKLLANLQAVQT